MKLDAHLIPKTFPEALPQNIVLWKNFRITVLFDRLFRVEEDAEKRFCDEATEAVWFRNTPPVSFETDEKNGKLFVKTEKAALVLAKTIEKSYVLLNGRRIPLDNRENLLGTASTLDTCDGNLKKQSDGTFAPLQLDMAVIAKNGVAVLDYTKSSVLTAEGMIRKQRQDSLDLYIFAYGHDYRAAIRAYYAICGDTPKLPRYALGNWWSRYHEYTDREYLNILDRMAERDIPLTVATVDMDWHWNTKNIGHAPKAIASGKDLEHRSQETGWVDGASGWTGYSWNTEFFPDYKDFLKKIHDRGCAVTLNLHPATGVRWFEDVYEEMAEAMGIDPKTEATVKMDFTDPAFINNYFKILHKPYEHDGVDFWWIDWQQGPRAKAAGIDIMWVLNHYHTLDNAKEHMPLILSRYSGVGAHRYPLGFSGDAAITWDTLRYQPYFTANASNIGFTWWSHDIGGHMGGIKDDELYLRSVQFGVFSPIMRLHCSDMEFCTKEPMAYMNGKGLIAEEFLRLRHRMIPYLYSAMLDTHENGKALIEPLYYDYPDSEEAYQFKNQYFFGGQLLVAPITEKSDGKGMVKTEVWLPEGRWTDIFTGEEYEGGRIISMVRWLDTIPVLAKEGGFFLLDKKKHTNDIQIPTHLEVLAFNGNGSYLFREDEGNTSFTAKEENGKQIFEIYADAGVITRKMTVKLRNLIKADIKVYANGERCFADLNEDGCMIITLDEVQPDTLYTIEAVYTNDEMRYRKARFLDALTKLEIPYCRKNMLWELCEETDDNLKYAIQMNVFLTDIEKIKLLEVFENKK